MRRMIVGALALSLGACNSSAEPKNEMAFNTDIKTTEQQVEIDTNAALAAGAEADKALDAAANSLSNAPKDVAEKPAKSGHREGAASLPYLDTDSYCRKIGDTAGGSYQIERTCRSMERDAHSELLNMGISARTMSYCTKIGETAGGSYTIMKTCAEQESEAASNL